MEFWRTLTENPSGEKSTDEFAIWNANNLSSGEYFYTVEIENTMLESKLVLLK